MYQIKMPDGSIWEADLLHIAMLIVGPTFASIDEHKAKAEVYIQTHEVGDIIKDARELSWSDAKQFMRRVKIGSDPYVLGWKVGDVVINKKEPETGGKRRLCKFNDCGYCSIYTNYYGATNGKCTDNENCEGWE